MKKILLTLLLLLTPATSFGALTFGASSSDRVNIPAGSKIDNFTTFTTIFWVRATTFTAGGKTVFIKGASGAIKRANWTSAGLLDALVDRTTDSNTVTNAFSLNTWYCVAVTYSEADGIRIYSKTRSTNMAENSYSTRTAGSGATVNDSGAGFNIGNNAFNTSAHIGQIGDIAYYNRVLSLSQMKTWCTRPQNLPGGKPSLWLKLGFNRNSTVRDLSGNQNTGTITGATMAKHQPSQAF